MDFGLSVAPRDDINIVVILRFPKFNQKHRQDVVLQKYSQIIGVPVTIAETITLEDLLSVPHRLHWYELAASNCVLYGPDHLLDEVRTSLGFTGTVPGKVVLYPGEALRLHMRSGLSSLHALRVANGHDPASSDRRPLEFRYYQSVLHLVDVILADSDIWEWSVRLRIEMLDEVLNQETWFLQRP